MKRYNPAEIEPKWQQIWADERRYEAQNDSDAHKFYVSGMFPYPSGAGMHVGHTLEHAIVDSLARFYRQHGMNVLNPMGWDAFGLPAENYAIKTGTPPAEVTQTNLANFKTQLQRLGTSIDWSREINTSDPEYYRWTQWIFAEFFKRGLAYQKQANQWWCPKDKTVLANEQVVNGRCWRCEELVVKKPMKQWFFKITDYADALLDEIPALDWPDKIKTAQVNWIGRSEGAEVAFAVADSDQTITVFTTRPDTIFGVSFLVLAPEHPLVAELTTDGQRDVVDEYVAAAIKKSEIERMSEGKEKTGVATGGYVINPANGERVPVYVADYVLSGYGTGAVMGVAGHDVRDREFATKFDLPIVEVIEKPVDNTDECYHGEGVLKNSGQFDGTDSADAREQIVAWLEQQGVGKSQVTYKMRDWLISRQRYWGAPIPIIHCPDHGAVAVPTDQLPVELPHVEDYAPKGDGKSVLAGVTDWVNTTCPTCGGPAMRETDTMDGFACSSWYLLRYTDPHNTELPFAKSAADYWAPLDIYVGGDHAVAHLLYVRFWSHVFYDMGLTGFKEPVKKLVYHGLIGAEDGRKMSKSLGNVVDPLDVIDDGYGADALRVFELFLGPIDDDSPWNARGIAGVYKFLTRVWTLTQEYLEAGERSTTTHDDAIRTATARVTRKVTDDYHRLGFNTAIAALMEFTNELYKYKVDGFSDEVWGDALRTLAQLVSPMAPHLGAELWQQLTGDANLDAVAWPTWDESLLVADTVTVVVQVNGKLRAKLTVPAGQSRDELQAAALADENVQKFVTSDPRKVIIIPDKLVNIVV